MAARPAHQPTASKLSKENEPSYKLTYFNLEGCAEVIRLAFQCANIPFEDERLDFSEWNEDRKAATPYGQLPVLTVSGRVISQSKAILRYVGKLGGLYPSDPFSAMEVDEMADLCSDVQHRVLVPSFYVERNPIFLLSNPGLEKGSAVQKEKADEITKALRRKMMQPLSQNANGLRRWLGNFEKKLRRSESGFLVGPSLTIADLLVFRMCRWLTMGVLDHIPSGDDFFTALHLPLLASHYMLISRQPAVEAWYSDGLKDKTLFEQTSKVDHLMKHWDPTDPKSLSKMSPTLSNLSSRKRKTPTSLGRRGAPSLRNPQDQ